MSLPATVVWELRSATGNDTNSGGFVAGGTGTDFSQQASPQYSVTDGVTAGTTTITSATANFGTDVVDNIVYVAGGTGSVTAVLKRIVSRTNATAIVVDSSTGLTAGTGVTIHIGGAFATPTPLAAAFVAGNKAFATGLASTTTGWTFSASVTPSPSNTANYFIGYGSVRGDNGQFTLTATSGSAYSLINFSGAGWMIQNITANCNSLTTVDGIRYNGQNSQVRNCLAKNSAYRGINATSGSVTAEVWGCEVTGCSAGYGVLGASVLNSNIHDNTGAAPIGGNNAGQTFDKNLITNNSGSLPAIEVGVGAIITDNTIHGNGQDGISLANGIPQLVRGNIITSNGRYGLNCSTGAIPADPSWDGNAYWNNTTAARNNADSVTGINGVNPYTNTKDVTLTGSPYIGPTTGSTANFGINNTAGAGALCRAVAVPTSWPGNTGTTNYEAMGAVQPQQTISNPIGSRFIKSTT